jgi:endo-1,4-beta-xylanase
VWDVVNEPLDPGQPDCLNHGPFYKVLSADYLNVAFEAARQYAPPGTELFFNDYSTTDPKRLACLITVFQRLREEHVPVDGVGHEMHNRINYPSALSMFDAIETMHRRFPHIRQQVTELDVSIYLASDNTSNYGANGGTVPPSLIAEQGWLYENYFKEFRKLKGKLEAVTIWGFGDDDTWLDFFPITRLDLPLPFDTRLQAKPAYWGIVDPKELPGAGLSFALTSRTGPAEASVWTITATNPSSGTAYSTQINGFVLKQVSGEPCTPTITPPSSYPVVLGDIPATGTASAAFTINFSSCEEHSRFILEAPWSSATYETGTLIVGRDDDHDQDDDE